MTSNVHGLINPRDFLNHQLAYESDVDSNYETESDFSADESDEEVFTGPSTYNTRSKGDAGIYQTAADALKVRDRLGSDETSPADLVLDTTIVVTPPSRWSRPLLLATLAIASIVGMYIGVNYLSENTTAIKAMCDDRVKDVAAANNKTVELLNTLHNSTVAGLEASITAVQETTTKVCAKTVEALDEMFRCNITHGYQRIQEQMKVTAVKPLQTVFPSLFNYTCEALSKN